MKERELAMSEKQAGEDRQERTARELIELLNELRGILPGVQVLFAFLLIAPSAHHRILWRGGAREQRLELGNVLTITGLIFLLPAIVGVVFLITAFIFDLTAAVVVTGLLALFFARLWFVLPLRYREGED
jgi:hypothetical protein